jgi:type I restriction-modification system DNA methylase subunit
MKMNQNKDLQLENEQLKKQIAELSKFKHERKGGSKKKTLDQISTPAHISEFMRDLASNSEKEPSMVIDISCGAGSLLIP